MWRVDSLEKTDSGRDWGQEEKGTTEDEMAGWHHWLDGHASEWTPGVVDGQGGLACCDSWGRKRVGYDWETELNYLCFQVKWLLCSLGSQGSSHIVLKLICSRPEDLVFSPHSAAGEMCETWAEGKRKRVEVTPDLAVCALLMLYFNL